MKAVLRVRISERDAHYGGKLAPGAKALELFGDIATELAIRHDGDEGLLAGYERVELKAPVHAGDFLEVTGEIVKVGKSSRTIEFRAVKYIATRPDVGESAADLLTAPVLVATARGTTVVKTDRQRVPRPAGAGGIPP